MKSVVAGLQKLMTIESHHQSWSSCNTGEVARELNVDHSMVIWHLKQIGKVKNLDKLVPHELIKNKKIFKNHSFDVFYSMQQQQTTSRSDCDMRQKDCIRQWRWPAQWLDQEEASKNFPKPNLNPKKCHGHCLVDCCPSDPLQLSESQRKHYIWEVSSAHQKLEHLKPAMVNRKGPILLHNSAWLHAAQPAFQKLNELGYEVLPHLPYTPDLPATDYHFLKHFNNFL